MLCALFIVFQDFKERAVFWFLFPILGICHALVWYKHTTTSTFWICLLFNVLLVSMVLLLLFIYTQKIRGVLFLNHSLGLGDMLFFYALAVGFPPATFIVVFSFSIFFSWVGYVIFRDRMLGNTIPLAGFMALFLAGVIGYSIFFTHPSLYFL